MTLFPGIAAIAGGLLLSVSAVAAQESLPKPHDWEVSTMAGFHLFSDTVELGVPDTVDTAHPEHGPLVGFRGLYKFRNDFGLEAEVTVTPTSANISGESITVFGWRAHLVVPLGYTFWRFESQLVAGGGGISTTGSGIHERADQIASDSDLLFHWGVTGRIRLNDSWHIRGDARHLLVPSTDFGFPFTNDFEFVAGIAFRFGGHGRLARSATGDRDADGVSDADDRCPGQREDVDGFEDLDGCPEVDNDNDGIRDTSDLCPNKPENINDFEDADGCPDEPPPATPIPMSPVEPIPTSPVEPAPIPPAGDSAATPPSPAPTSADR